MIAKLNKFELLCICNVHLHYVPEERLKVRP